MIDQDEQGRRVAAQGPIVLPWRGVGPRIDRSVFVAPGASIIGDVHIGAGSSIWFGCTVRGDVNHVRIGARTNVQDGTVIHVTGGGHPTLIGDGVTIGHMALLHACTLQDACFVGMGAMVLDGAVVETGGMLAAGAFLMGGKRVPYGELWAGRPAKLFRKLSEDDIRGFDASAERYATLAAEYLARDLGG